MIRLAHYFNKTILACIPSLFEDQEPRCFKLVGIEEFGLWLESEELAGMLQSQEGARSPQGAMAAFFPFSQIAYVIPEVHPLSLLARPPIPAEPKEQQPKHPDKPPRTEHQKRYPTTHRKGKK